jgi:acyl-coenzyme A synthetase/AMP-(fatty) acid ligase
VLVVEALPRTSIGKPRRLALAAELGRRSGDDEP